MASYLPVCQHLFPHFPSILFHPPLAAQELNPLFTSGKNGLKLHSLPLGAVGVAGMAFVVGLGVFEDETVGALQPVRALLHAVGPVFEIEAFHALVRAL